jgi:hypothetical protein
VEQGSKVFGEDFVSYNVHSLIHLVSEVRKHGPAEKWSAFFSENYFRHLVDLVKGTTEPHKQMMMNICKQMVGENEDNPGGEKRKFREFRCYLSFPQKNDVLFEFTKFNKCHLDGFELNCKRAPDSFCEVLVNGVKRYIKCNSFFSDLDHTKFVDAFELIISDEEVYTYPRPASGIGIYRVTGVSDVIRRWRVSRITRKMYCLPISQCPYEHHFIVPFLHLSE